MVESPMISEEAFNQLQKLYRVQQAPAESREDAPTGDLGQPN